METKMTEEKLVEVARTREILAGEMKHVEVEGYEIAIVNINRKYYAIDDRCGHMCTPLSMGVTDGNAMTCPFHGAQFDCTTGRKVKEPNLTPSPMEGLPDAWKKNIEKIYSLVSNIRTRDQKTYDVTMDGDRIKISLQDKEVSPILSTKLHSGTGAGCGNLRIYCDGYYGWQPNTY
jgi:nitrite reductase/ring-hydroxylating ferredoxin subunit